MNAIRTQGQALRGAAFLVLILLGVLLFGTGAFGPSFFVSGALVSATMQVLPWLLKLAGWRPRWVLWLEERDRQELTW